MESSRTRFGKPEIIDPPLHAAVGIIDRKMSDVEVHPSRSADASKQDLKEAAF
jgi:hypothetical protein